MSIPTLIALLFCTVISLLGMEDNRARELVARIKNSDVDFQGEYPGIVAHISGTSDEVRKIDANAVPFLYDALKDRNRYIAAHVLLTHIVQKSWQYSAADWNHLVVDSFGPATDLSVKDQRDTIGRFWAEQRKPNAEPNQSAHPPLAQGQRG